MQAGVLHRWRTVKWGGRLLCFAALSLEALGGLGCHRVRRPTQEEQFRAAINDFYADEPSCLWQTMVALDGTKYPGQAIPAKQLPALQAAGLVEAGSGPGAVVLTGEGKKAWRPQGGAPQYGDLCYGRWRVSRVGKATPDRSEVFGDVTEVEFDAVVEPQAAWTRVPALREAFPLMALETSHPMTHSATMKQVKGDWKVVASVVDEAAPAP